MSAPRPRAARALALCALGVAAWLSLAFIECLLTVSAHREAPSDARADVAVVLGAAVWGHSRPSPVLERRLRAALALYHSGRVRALATTGGVGRVRALASHDGAARAAHEPPLAEGVASARWLARHGVPARDLLVEDRSRNTVENLRFLAPTLRARGLTRALIVSDGYHLGRAVTLARDAGLSARGVSSDGSVQRSLAREPHRRFSEAQWLMLYGLVRPTARW